MAFTPRFDLDGKTVLMPCATSQTIVKGSALADNGSGYLALATSSTATPVTHVAMEAVTTTSNGQLVNCVRTLDGIFEADCDAAWAQTDVGTYADMATDLTINPDASTHDLFYIERGIGEAAVSTKVQGWFMHAAPNA